MGAEFVHGRPPELIALIEEAGLELYERDGTRVCWEDGSLKDCSGGQQEMVGPIKRLKEMGVLVSEDDRRNTPAPCRGRRGGGW